MYGLRGNPVDKHDEFLFEPYNMCISSILILLITVGLTQMQ